VRTLKPSLILSILAIITVIANVVLLCLIQSFSVLQLQEYAVQLAGQASLKNIITNVVTNKNVLLVKYTMASLIGLALLACYYLYQNKKEIDIQIVSEKHKIFAAIKQLFQKSNFSWALLLPLIFLAVHSAYYIIYWAIQYDEAWTYTNFINKPLLLTLFAPYNNHNLFTTLAWPLQYLPINTKILLRALALLPVALSLLVWHRLQLKFYTNKHSLFLGNILYACMMPVLYYAICARGYGLIFLFTVLLLHRLLLLIHNAESKRHYIISGVIIALGLYSNLCFAYQLPALCIVALLGIFKKQISLKYCLGGLGICLTLCIALLGVPLLVFGNLQQLGSTAQFGTNSTSTFGFDKVAYFFTSFNNAYWLYILVSLACIFRFKKYTLWCVLILSQVAFIFIFIMLQGNALFERSFVYLSPYFSLGFILFLSTIKMPQVLKSTTAVAFMALSVFLFQQHPLFTWCIGLDKDVQTAAIFCIKNNHTKIYMPHNYCKPGFEYYFNEAHIDVQIALPNKNSVDYKELDTTYQAIICNAEDTTKYHTYTQAKQFGQEVIVRTKK
jgi:hypothetical protein